MLSLVLASGSPRRRDLLRAVGLDFTVQVPDVDEAIVEGEPPELMVERLAAEKAEAVAQSLAERGETAMVIGADTTVVLNGEILGKPHSPDDACRMLRLLSGNTHTVYTGFAVIAGTERTVGHERTDVTFRALEQWEIEEYVAGGSPMDKAGAYGIQEDRGAVFVERIAGDYYTVVGLPLCRLWLAMRNVAAASGVLTRPALHPGATD